MLVRSKNIKDLQSWLRDNSYSATLKAYNKIINWFNVVLEILRPVG